MSAPKVTDLEWQTDTLASASSTNQNVEGDDATNDAAVPTVRLGNYCEIPDKTIQVSGTLEAIKKAGRNSELAYQMTKRSKEIKRDMETSILQNKARSAGTSSTARVTAGMGAWITTNVNNAGGSGNNPPGDGTAARTDGTQRAFTEAQLKNVLQQCWEEGAEPKMLMVGAFNKGVASGFPGIATKTKEVDDKRTVATVDVYVSDFSTLRIVPNRFQRARDAWVVDPEYAELAYLRPFKVQDLAKTGDSMRKQMLAEFALVVKNEKAHGLIADLTTS